MNDIIKDTIKIKSARFNREFNAVVYEREDSLIITHTSLNQIFTFDLSDEERPKAMFDTVNLAQLPNIPPMFAIKCIMQTPRFYTEQYGEMLCQAWEVDNSINKNNPLAICRNRAFDKAFLRFMQFKVPVNGYLNIYSSVEIPIDSKAVLLSSLNSQNINPSTPAPAMPSVASNEYNQKTTTGNPSQNRNMQPPQRGNSVQLRIRRVTYEHAFRKIKVETTCGIFLFDPQTGVWESQSVDIRTVNVRMLYNEASKFLGFSLKNFKG